MAKAASADEIWRVKGVYHVVSSVSIVIFTYSLQQMVFPTYTELEKRSNERFASVSLISTLIYSSAFILTGLVGVFIFGSDVKSDFLVN